MFRVQSYSSCVFYTFTHKIKIVQENVKKDTAALGSFKVSRSTKIYRPPPPPPAQPNPSLMRSIDRNQQQRDV